jgi:hypothetical protein
MNFVERLTALRQNIGMRNANLRFGIVEGVMKVHTLAAVAALALGTVMSGGAAQAADVIYTLNVDGCGCFDGQANAGTVTVTQDGASLDFLVSLTGNIYVNNNGNANSHFALAFNLPGVPVSDLSLTAFSTGISLAPPPGPYNEPPPGSLNWDDAINYTPPAGVNGNGTGGNPQSFSFTLTDSAGSLLLSDLTSPGVSGGHDVYVGADVWNSVTGKTGNVFATGPNVGVPEPATWGLMITGVFFVGAAMRQRRHRARATA